jgi:hypothetical protein
MIIRIHRSFFGGQQRCCSVVEPPSMVRTNPSEVKKATYWKTYWRSNLDLILLPTSSLLKYKAFNGSKFVPKYKTS